MPHLNQRIGEYLLDVQIGRGTFGEVWRARHHAWPDQIVAVKIPTDPRYLQNLRHEGVAVHGLRHPDIVRALSFDPGADPAYLVVEYVPGTSLRPLIERRCLGVNDAVVILRRVLGALGYAHSKGIVHRDVKPENVLVHEAALALASSGASGGFDADGRVKLTDFGLGKAVNAAAGSIVQSASLTGGLDARVAGTLDYMAPEQREGREVDARADLYACGVMLYEMLTGRRPAGMELPSEVNPAVPKRLDEVFRRAYARLEKRFESAGQFLEALAEATRPAPVVLSSAGAQAAPLAANAAGRGGASTVAVAPPAGRPSGVGRLLTMLPVGPSRVRRTIEEDVARLRPSLGDPGLQRMVPLLRSLQSQHRQEWDKARRMDWPEGVWLAGLCRLAGYVWWDFAPNPAAAAYHFRRAAEKGFSPAMVSLANLYRWGAGPGNGSADSGAKAAMSPSSASASPTRAVYAAHLTHAVGGEDAREHCVTRDEYEAAKWYRKAAAAGDAVGMWHLGGMYANREGVPQDWFEAARWWSAAAGLGHGPAQAMLASCYAEGRGVPQDLAQAVRWHSAAATQGHVPSMAALAEIYAEGRGVTKDATQSAGWYRLAAEAGDARAQFELANCYAEGRGVAPDWGQAVRWYHKAAEAQLPIAQRKLGECYAQGKGVERDLFEAVAWHRKAAAKDEQAERWLREQGLR